MSTGVLISRPKTTQAKALARVVIFLGRGRGVAWRGGGRTSGRVRGEGVGVDREGCFVLRCAK